MTPTPTLEASTLPSVLLDRVGLEFLTRGGPSLLADSAGRPIWSNGAWLEFVDKFPRHAETHEPILPWSIGDIVAAVRAGAMPYVTREDRIDFEGGIEIFRSRHWVGFALDGRVDCIASAIDLPSPTDRLRSQLAQLQERLDDITRLVSDWIWETAPNLTFSFVSPRIGDALAYHAHELMGRSLTACGCFIDEHGNEVPMPLDPEAPRPFADRPFRMVSATGAAHVFCLSGVPVFDSESGKFKGFRGTARDAMPELLARDQLSASQNRLNHAIEVVSDGFALFDADERLVLCNRRFAQLYRQSGAQFQIGMRFRDLMVLAWQAGDLISDEASNRLLTESLIERAARRETVEYNLSESRWIRASERLTVDSSVVVIHQEITELKNRERALIEAKVEAESANRSKSEFLANISHELRTPLNAIIGFSELILQEALGPIGHNLYKDYLADVLASGRHLLDIINDIIELSKAESGQLDLAEEAIEIDKSIAAVFRLVHERALRGHIRMLTEIEPRLPLLRVDPRKFRQILTALISNSIKFTPPGGTVTISARHERAAGELLIEVADNGIGIAPEHIALALKPFGQIDGSFSRKYGGVGLGLPLTRAMVELHGGRIGIDSTVGSGTVVTIRLPDHRLVRSVS
jgi:signal transduction histidine kinase